MPVPHQYPETSWSQRKLRTQADVEDAADIQRRAQSSGVRGWDEEHDTQPGDNHYRHNNQIAVVIEPGASHCASKMR